MARCSTARSRAASSARPTRSRCSARTGADFHALLQAADAARALDKGDDVSFVICRNINFTNVCYVGCTFCGFSRHEDDADAYDHPMEKLVAKARDAVARGATEVCIQGGIHPRKDHTHYRDILVALKREFPKLHIHAFSPEEIHFAHKKTRHAAQGAARAGCVDAGLGTMPGTAAEILDDEIRKIISPNKLRRALGRDRDGRARDRAALDLDDHVRPHRDSRATSPRTSR